MNEQFSAWLDGEVDPAASGHLIRSLRGDGARETWGVYHCIGDALRGDTACNVLERVAERLADEPTVIAPRAILGQQTRNIALSAAASVAAVFVVGYMALTTGRGDAALDRYDSVQPVALERNPAPALNDYFAMHHGEVKNVDFQPLREAAR